MNKMPPCRTNSDRTKLPGLRGLDRCFFQALFTVIPVNIVNVLDSSKAEWLQNASL